MKLRLLFMGSILMVLGAVFLAAKGYGTGEVGILVIGLALLVLGVVWK
jgi:dipeptide/tripeptide permease